MSFVIDFNGFNAILPTEYSVFCIQSGRPGQTGTSGHPTPAGIEPVTLTLLITPALSVELER